MTRLRKKLIALSSDRIALVSWYELMPIFTFGQYREVNGMWSRAIPAVEGMGIVHNWRPANIDNTEQLGIPYYFLTPITRR